MKRGLAFSIAGLALAGLFPAKAAGPQKSLGFVIVAYNTAQYETKFFEECPDGLAIGNDELWWKGLSPQDRDKLTNGGEIEPVDPPRRPMAGLRGPNKEDVCWNPTIVKDPPLRVIKGKLGYGFNLDGTEDGSATAKSCKHEKFTTPDGKTKVDNQLYRMYGCIYGWRKGNYMEDHANRERRDASQGIIVLEVTGVDDEQNDPDVTVAYESTLDVLPKDHTGRILPYASYRTTDTPHYGTKAKGKIVDGRLTTEPVDVRLPVHGHNITGDMFIKAFRIDMPLAAASATDETRNGMMGGYYDFDSWWDYIRKIEFLTVTGQWSCPAMYVAGKELADGYPDPDTGECTAISTGMTFEAIPAFIVPKEARTTEAR